MHGIDAVFFNRDYTPFSVNRDAAITKLCGACGVAVYECDDALLHNPQQIISTKGTPYTIFTPYYRSALQCAVPKPRELRLHNFFSHTLDGGVDELGSLASIASFVTSPESTPELQSREVVLARLQQLSDYENTHNMVAVPTSGLSKHLKFGTVSVRRAYHAIVHYLGDEHPLIRQLYWRDFFTQIAAHYPQVFGHAFKQRYDHIAWDNNPEWFSRWCAGTTGFPIVDAGMRELNTTGFMHNRARMVAASFLVKDLLIDWRWGERYFATQLVDYDPAVNNGNWQWCASTGCDAQPYMRIFNPWLQQKRFDPQCVYIKRWIPELRDLNASQITMLYKNSPPGLVYPLPIVCHEKQRRKALALYKNS